MPHYLDPVDGLGEGVASTITHIVYITYLYKHLNDTTTTCSLGATVCILD